MCFFRVFHEIENTRVPMLKSILYRYVYFNKKIIPSGYDIQSFYAWK